MASRRATANMQVQYTSGLKGEEVWKELAMVLVVLAWLGGGIRQH
jgi:hypothetical protein